MAYEMLQEIVGTAVIEPDFRNAILGGSRQGAIGRFDLSYEEADAVMSIQAETLAQFAGQLDQWIMKQENRLEPMALDLPPCAPVSSRELNSQMASAPFEMQPGLCKLLTAPSLGNA